MPSDESMRTFPRVVFKRIKTKNRRVLPKETTLSGSVHPDLEASLFDEVNPKFKQVKAFIEKGDPDNPTKVLIKGEILPAGGIGVIDDDVLYHYGRQAYAEGILEHPLDVSDRIDAFNKAQLAGVVNPEDPGLPRATAKLPKHLVITDMTPVRTLGQQVVGRKLAPGSPFGAVTHKRTLLYPSTLRMGDEGNALLAKFLTDVVPDEDIKLISGPIYGGAGFDLPDEVRDVNLRTMAGETVNMKQNPLFPIFDSVKVRRRATKFLSQMLKKGGRFFGIAGTIGSAISAANMYKKIQENRKKLKEM